MDRVTKGISYEFVLRRLATILSVTVLTLAATAAITGILLSIYYQPIAGGAYSSIKMIVQDVPSGWLIYGVHNIAGNGLIGASLIQMVVMFLGERFRRSWLTAWFSVIFLILTAIGLGWTAMILDWSQLGYWRFKIELGTIEAIPLIGRQVRDILTGGAVNSLTVERLYTLHSYVLSAAALFLAVVHLVSLIWQEKEEKERLLSAIEETPTPNL